MPVPLSTGGGLVGKPFDPGTNRAAFRQTWDEQPLDLTSAPLSAGRFLSRVRGTCTLV